MDKKIDKLIDLQLANEEKRSKLFDLMIKHYESK